MAEFLVQDTSLSAVADKIREKTGDSGKLEFPNEWMSALDKVGSGGSTFDVSVCGFIPDYEHGYATAELTDVFTASAVGAIK